MAQNNEMGIWLRLVHYLVIAFCAWIGLAICYSAHADSGVEYVIGMLFGVFLLSTALLTGIGTLPRRRHNFFRRVRIAAIGLNLVLIGLAVCLAVWAIFVDMRSNTLDIMSIIKKVVLFLCVGLSNCAFLFLIHSVRFTDPSTCQKCGYDLRGSDSPRCPECGKERVDDGEN